MTTLCEAVQWYLIMVHDTGCNQKKIHEFIASTKKYPMLRYSKVPLTEIYLEDDARDIAKLIAEAEA